MRLFWFGRSPTTDTEGGNFDGHQSDAFLADAASYYGRSSGGEDEASTPPHAPPATSGAFSTHRIDARVWVVRRGRYRTIVNRLGIGAVCSTLNQSSDDHLPPDWVLELFSDGSIGWITPDEGIDGLGESQLLVNNCLLPRDVASLTFIERELLRRHCHRAPDDSSHVIVKTDSSITVLIDVDDFRELFNVSPNWPMVS